MKKRRGYSRGDKIQVVCTTQQRALIEAVAEAEQMTASRYVMSIVLPAVMNRAADLFGTDGPHREDKRPSAIADVDA